MPVAVFSIGSFGDIVTMLQLAFSIRAALSDASGASADVRALVADIDSFVQALRQVQLTLDARRAALTPDLVNGILHALSTCHNLLQHVQAQITSFQDSLSRNQGPAWRKYWAMTAWSMLGGKQRVDDLKRRLAEQLTVIQTYLAVGHCQDQEMLLKRAETQGATLVRIFDVVQDISKRFDVGVPPFHFFDEQTSRYYLPLARTSLIRFCDFYESVARERISREQFLEWAAQKKHRTMYLHWRPHLSLLWRPPIRTGRVRHLRVECFVFNEAAFDQPQVLVGLSPSVYQTKPTMMDVVKAMMERTHGIGCACNCGPALCHSKFADDVKLQSQACLLHVNAMNIGDRLRAEIDTDPQWAQYYTMLIRREKFDEHTVDILQAMEASEILDLDTMWQILADHCDGGCCQECFDEYLANIFPLWENNTATCWDRYYRLMEDHYKYHHSDPELSYLSTRIEFALIEHLKLRLLQLATSGPST